MQPWGRMEGIDRWKEFGLYIFSHKHTKYNNLVGSLCIENMILHLIPSTLATNTKEAAVEVAKGESNI